jgi:hypothetical protein
MVQLNHRNRFGMKIPIAVKEWDIWFRSHLFSNQRETLITIMSWNTSCLFLKRQMTQVASGSHHELTESIRSRESIIWTSLLTISRALVIWWWLRKREFLVLEQNNLWISTLRVAARKHSRSLVALTSLHCKQQSIKLTSRSASTKELEEVQICSAIQWVTSQRFDLIRIIIYNNLYFNV